MSKPITPSSQGPDFSQSRRQFDGLAANYAASPVHRSGPSLPLLVQYADPKPDELALDVATGTGNAAFAIGESGARVIGIDVARKMLAEAQTRAETEGRSNVSFQVGAAEAIPFPNATFDLVVARHAPHHFRDAEMFLSEVRTVLKPNGRFVMVDQIAMSAEAVDWIDFWQRQRDPSHFLQRTKAEWQQLAASAGFAWEADTLVPYRMEFDWWVRQSGATPEVVERLRAHARTADGRIREQLQLEFDDAGEVSAFTEQMMLVRMSPK